MSNSYEELVIFSLFSSLLKYLCSFHASVRATVVFSHSGGKCVVRASSIFVVDSTTNKERLSGTYAARFGELLCDGKTSWSVWDQRPNHVWGNTLIQSRMRGGPLALTQDGPHALPDLQQGVKWRCEWQKVQDSGLPFSLNTGHKPKP